MVIFTAALAVIAILLDAITTYDGLRIGHSEGNPIRRFLIRILGLKGGTFGAAIVAATVVVWMAFLPHTSVWAMSIGNLLVALVFGYAAYSNYRKVY